MGKTYKVHRNFDDDWITMENPCRCSSPESGVTIFDEAPGNLTVQQTESLLHYNSTRNGTVFSAADIEWDHLSKSECHA